MKIKIVSSLLILSSAFSAFAGDGDALLAKTTREREQKQCAIEIKKSCNGLRMDPLYDSHCMIGKMEITNGPMKGKKDNRYVVYYNQRLKVVTFVDLLSSCKVDQKYFAGTLSKFEVFNNNLWMLINGKPYFFDTNSKLQELLSQNGKSYNNGTAFVQDINASTDGSKITLSRQYSVHSDTIQVISVKASEINETRTQTVPPTQYNTRVKQLDADADIYF